MFAPFMQGFGTGGGLIVAIGAQNAFVLSQGVRKNHHLIIAMICIFFDVVFITAGVAGFGTAVSANPTLSQWVAWGGAGFLFLYGWGSFRSAMRGGSLDSSNPAVRSLKAVIIATIAVTLLNPHFYQPVSRGKSAIFLDRGRLCIHALVHQPEPRGADACAPV